MLDALGATLELPAASDDPLDAAPDDDSLEVPDDPLESLDSNESAPELPDELESLQLFSVEESPS